MTAPLNAVTLRLTLDGTMGRTTFETEALAPTEVAAALAAWTKYARRPACRRTTPRAPSSPGCSTISTAKPMVRTY